MKLYFEFSYFLVGNSLLLIKLFTLSFMYIFSQKHRLLIGATLRRLMISVLFLFGMSLGLLLGVGNSSTLHFHIFVIVFHFFVVSFIFQTLFTLILRCFLLQRPFGMFVNPQRSLRILFCNP